MKRLIALLLSFSVLQAIADEGMYLPFTIKQNYPTMRGLGLEMKPNEIYHPKKPSLKDAIVSFGGYCTAEIISPKGLLLTNHHCGYDAIAESSTPENDYLTDGFWAKDHASEIPIPGLTASIVVRVEDVTKQVQAVLHDKMDEDERSLAIKKISKELSDKAVSGTHYYAYVREFYEGNEFYLFVTEIFEDVRLVGTPPSAIGKFGGDTDNWMWERQTGDFSMFRIYAGKDNKPAKFAMDNQPYAPKHYLPISIAGIEEGDYTMIMGYPGRTNRYLTSYGVKTAVEVEQPKRVEIRAKKLALMKEQMDNSDKVRLMYASTYAQVSNYWKYFIGQSEQLKKNKVYDKKVAIEKAFAEWVAQDEKRKAKYGNVLKDIEDAFAVLDKYVLLKVYYGEAIASLSTSRFIFRHIKLNNLLSSETPNNDAIMEEAKALKEISADYFKNMDALTETFLMSSMLEMYSKGVNPEFQPEMLKETADSIVDLKGWIDFVKTGFTKSIFTRSDLYDEFTATPSAEVLQNDPFYNLVYSILDSFRNIAYGNEASAAQAKLDKANRLFIAGLREMNPDKNFYPNANSTLRLTYGSVQKYKTADKNYDFYTTIESMMVKEDPNNEEFIIPAKLKELYEKKDYGRYGKDGTLWINFISNNDITGGNSGSPVINSKGQLIGCAFDGNWEAMSGDIAFEPELQRTISCDIRYILFVIEKYAGATHLIEEMTIVE